jgi:hypothetical protein
MTMDDGVGPTIIFCHHEAREQLLVAVVRRAYVRFHRVVAHKQLVEGAPPAQLQAVSWRVTALPRLKATCNTSACT